jgi:hypothetical protein
MSIVFNVCNAILFCCAFIPGCTLRFLFPSAFGKPRPFSEIQHACFQMILYNDIVRRSANFPVCRQGCFSIVLHRLCLTLITNALTYRNVCEMFVSRSNDSAFVDSNTMLELSHEFMSLSHITLEAMDACCNLSDAPRIKCMMWLLPIQRLQAQRFPFALSDASPEATPSALSVRKIFSEEFQPGDPLKSMKFGNFGSYFSSVCQTFNCEIEFRHDYDSGSDLRVCCVESELRHFVCTF